MEEYVKRIKKLQKKDKHDKLKPIYKYLSKTLIVVIITIVTLITLKAKPSLKLKFHQKVYEDNFSFAYVNKLYEKYFGKTLPLSNLFGFLDREQTVFNEKLTYNDLENYMDGVKITVENNYLVPCIETGLVIFIGDKEGYGNTVIIEQQDGTNVWYSNLKSISVNLYDYINKGSFIGEVDNDYMYLVFKQEGNIIDYKNYI
ncbi:MAG: M23 family metallopeptidase [Clostridium sp.]|nr:M23 family metallopeptidase [Clostridium sp.]MCM1444482.1 M23 family metallopeptidase [Candidatus Amulumruptor caecigallinarius]